MPPRAAAASGEVVFGGRRDRARAEPTPLASHRTATARRAPVIRRRFSTVRRETTGAKVVVVVLTLENERLRFQQGIGFWLRKWIVELGAMCCYFQASLDTPAAMDI